MKHNKKWIIVLLSSLILVMAIPLVIVRAEGINKPTAKEAVALKTNTNTLYDEINFSDCKPLAREVFDKAYRGYLNLKENGAVNNREILSVCDFSLSSNVPRLWVIDLKNKKVLFNTLVAHGQGTGEEFATKFSNIEDSHQSSIGFFVTENTYYGDKGYSLKINGKDVGYNNQAYSRAIVIHGADYVSYDFIRNNKRLGRSWGCPAVPTALARPIIDVIKGGTTLFIYAANNKYLAKSKWLNKTPQALENMMTPMPQEKNVMLADNLASNMAEDSINAPEKPKVVQRKEIPAEAFFQ